MTISDIGEDTSAGAEEPEKAKAQRQDQLASASTEPITTIKQVKKEQRRILFRSPGFIIGSLILVFWILASLFPSLLSTFDPGETVRNAEGGSMTSQGPNGTAWFGTTRLGRDVYSRVIFGARPILIIAPLATIIAVWAGTIVGMLTGYYRGIFDQIVSRLLEAILSIPAILLAILIVFTFGSTQAVITGTIAFLFIAPVARTVRAATLSESQLDYVTAARMRGESSLFIITREILPNVIGVVVVEATVRLGYAVFTLTTLAFLGLSPGDATNANWGLDVANNYPNIINGTWWPTIFPALAIASMVIGVNLIADAMEKAIKS